MAKLGLTKAHLLRILFPAEANSLGREERTGQARSDTCAEHCPTDQRGVKTLSLPSAGKYHHCKDDKSKKTV